VARPRSAADVVAVVELGRARGLTVVPRGRGHAVDGQAQTAGGLVVDLTYMAGVDDPAEDTITVRGGATWRDVVTAAAATGLAPPVVPDYLDLTVAGTVSVGGLGAATHGHGTVADTVLELEVVSPAGRVETCSPGQRSTLFDLVRGGQGRHGIITAARLRLAPAPADVSRVVVVHRDVADFLAEQERLASGPGLVGLLGQARPVRPGDWRFVLEATVAAPDVGGLLARLGGSRPQPVQRTTYADHLRRLDPEVARQRRTGAWDRPHPRCTLLVPGRHAGDVVSSPLTSEAAQSCCTPCRPRGSRPRGYSSTTRSPSSSVSSGPPRVRTRGRSIGCGATTSWCGHGCTRWGARATHRHSTTRESRRRQRPVANPAGRGCLAPRDSSCCASA
jgi:cytokinin dehydrogenase